MARIGCGFSGRFDVDKINIRPAVKADAAKIAQLWEALVDYHQQLDADLPKAALDGGVLYAERLFSGAYDETNLGIFVAELDNEIVGYVLGAVLDLIPDMFMQERCGFLADIFVEAPYRRCGVGKALVAALRVWFKERGLRHYEWYVASRNPAGHAFWQKMGGRDVMIRMRAAL